MGFGFGATSLTHSLLWVALLVFGSLFFFYWFTRENRTELMFCHVRARARRGPHALNIYIFSSSTQEYPSKMVPKSGQILDKPLGRTV